MENEDDHFECYWESLQILARKHAQRILDRDAWREPFDAGKSAPDAFYEEFPEDDQT